MRTTNGHHHSSRLSASVAKLLVLLISTLSSLASHPVRRSLFVLKDDDGPEEEPGSAAFWGKLGISAALILGGGVFAGLTIGLMGQDLINVT